MSDLFKSDLKTLRSTPARLAQISAKLARDIQAVRSDQRYSDAYKSEQIDALRANARQQVEGLREAAKTTERRLREKITATRNEQPTGDAALVRELAIGRAWRRAERLLNTGSDAIGLIQEAAEASDLMMLNALREELPTFLRSTGATPTIQPALKLIDRLELPLLGPDQQAAREVEAEIASGLPQLNSAIEFIGWAISGQDIKVIPGWAHREVINIPQES